MVLDMDLNMVLNMVLTMVLSIVLNMILNMVFNRALNIVVNMNSSRNTNIVSTKQFISFSIYITSFLNAHLRFYSKVFFHSCECFKPNKINEYSSSEMKSYDNAFEMRLLIVLSAETANIAISLCFSIFNESVLIARFPTTRSNLITILFPFQFRLALQRLLREGQLQLYLTKSQ